jgi:exosome complex RNA-binding protein Rrp4
LISVDVVVGDSGRIFVSNENEVVVMSPTIVLARVKAARVAILNETYMEGKKVIG